MNFARFVTIYLVLFSAFYQEKTQVEGFVFSIGAIAGAIAGSAAAAASAVKAAVVSGITAAATAVSTAAVATKVALAGAITSGLAKATALGAGAATVVTGAAARFAATSANIGSRIATVAARAGTQAASLATRGSGLVARSASAIAKTTSTIARGTSAALGNMGRAIAKVTTTVLRSPSQIVVRALPQAVRTNRVVMGTVRMLKPIGKVGKHLSKVIFSKESIVATVASLGSLSGRDFSTYVKESETMSVQNNLERIGNCTNLEALLSAQNTLNLTGSLENFECPPVQELPGLENSNLVVDLDNETQILIFADEPTWYNYKDTGTEYPQVLNNLFFSHNDLVTQSAVFTLRFIVLPNINYNWQEVTKPDTVENFSVGTRFRVLGRAHTHRSFIFNVQELEGFFTGFLVWAKRNPNFLNDHLVLTLNGPESFLRFLVRSHEKVMNVPITAFYEQQEKWISSWLFFTQFHLRPKIENAKVISLKTMNQEELIFDPLKESMGIAWTFFMEENGEQLIQICKATTLEMSPKNFLLYSGNDMRYLGNLDEEIKVDDCSLVAEGKNMLAHIMVPPSTWLFHVSFQSPLGIDDQQITPNNIAKEIEVHDLLKPFRLVKFRLVYVSFEPNENDETDRFWWFAANTWWKNPNKTLLNRGTIYLSFPEPRLTEVDKNHPAFSNKLLGAVYFRTTG